MPFGKQFTDWSEQQKIAVISYLNRENRKSKKEPSGIVEWNNFGTIPPHLRGVK